MKILIVLSIVFSAVCAGLIRNDIISLNGRVDKLLNASNQMLSEYRNHGRAHLLTTVESEVNRLNRFSDSIKECQLQNSNITLLELHKLEETLLHYENLLSEEFERVANVHFFKTTGQNANDLIDRAERLINSTNTEIAAHQAHGHRELIPLELEKTLISLLVIQLKAYPLLHIAVSEEETLIRHEMTLDNLFKRMKHLEH